MKNPVVLFRYDRNTEDEYKICSKYFETYTSRSQIPKDSLVIGRYSVLPFYKELEEDINFNGSKLLNTYRQHRYIADLQNWYQDFSDMTPKTWFRLQDVDEDGPYVLKGETNSKKYEWQTSMFAESKKDLNRVYSNLEKDSLIGQQNICIRQYVPLRTFRQDLAGKFPITEEYRFFIFQKKIISGGFYWSSHCDLLEDKSLNISADNVPRDMLQEITNRVGNSTNAFVVDVARTQQPFNPLFNKWPDWTIIEFNDFSMSGLSENDPYVLYSTMKQNLL